MSSQNEKFILDATAGFRMMWFNKKHPNCIYLDQRPECEPDIVGDFRDLKQFPDETFRLIVFDPPHFLREDGKEANLNVIRRFGVLRAEHWQSDIKAGFTELWRVLKPYGILIFKWSNHQLSSHELIALAKETPLFYQISMSRHRKGAKAGSDTVQTLWFCFMKIENEKKGEECKTQT